MRPLLVLFALSACGTGDFSDDPDTACNEDNEGCGPGDCDGEGASMLPGSDCLLCHTAGGGEGGAFTAAGTVFTDLDGTGGLADVTVRITDADGLIVELTSNSVGNFYTKEPLAFPIDAEVEVGGEVRAMATPVDTAACGSCHACEGAAGGKLTGP